MAPGSSQGAPSETPAAPASPQTRAAGVSVSMAGSSPGAHVLPGPMLGTGSATPSEERSMTQSGSVPPWLGGIPEAGEVTGSPPGFNEGELWIARHAADQDTLVFDPAESDPRADRISFYSLTQHRTRTFPRSVVLAQLEGIADDVGVRRAMRDYEDRAARQQEHAEAMAA